MQTYRAVAGLAIRSCMLVCCSRSCPLTSASQKLRNIVLFERCFLEIEQFQTHHFQQFLVIPQLCRAEQFRRCFPQYARTYMPGCQRCHFQLKASVQGLENSIRRYRNSLAIIAGDALEREQPPCHAVTNTLTAGPTWRAQRDGLEGQPRLAHTF